MRRTLWLALLLVPFSTSIADDDPHKQLTRFVYEQTEPHFAKRAEKFEQLIASDHTNRMLWRQLLKSRFIERLGGFPDRTPLNPKIVGELEGDGYKIEKLIYESRPGFFVTANLYLPESKPPYPGILFPCGHSENGKAAGVYQRTCQLLARNGMVVLCYDPIGQGERKQILVEGEHGKHLPRGEFKATSEHTITGVAPILLGENLATYCIWDGMRGLDYLASRDDIDAQRLGCTGNSGGGLMTSYLVALDDRIKAAAPGCFITTTKRKNVSPGPGDAEQNIFGQIADGLDHSDYLMLGVPCATLICSATKDFVPIEGTWEAFREAKRFYTAEGIPERLELIEVNEQHGYTKPLRIAATNWMSRWLLGKQVSVQETELPLHSDQDLQCTPRGQVLLLPDAKSMTDLCVEKSKQLADKRTQWIKQHSPYEIRKKLDDLLGTRLFETNHAARFDHVRTLKRDGYQIDQLTIKPRSGIDLPAMMYVPNKADGSLTLFLRGNEIYKKNEAKGPIDLVKEGKTVLSVELRESVKQRLNRGDSARVTQAPMPPSTSFLTCRDTRWLECAPKTF